jgi:hypothetical protein
MVTKGLFAGLAALALMAPAAQLHAAPQFGIQGRIQTPRYSPYTSPAYDEGYQRGLRAGENDGRRGRSFNFADEGDYRRADTGYRSQYGARDRYRDQFRGGFEQGYRDGYGRYGYDRRNGSGYPNYPGQGRSPYGNSPYGNYGGNYNGSYPVSNVAYENGFKDGFDEGAKDGRGRRANDPIAESRYRNGDHGFNGRYGARELYKTAYRQGFLQGYDRGYRENWYR